MQIEDALSFIDGLVFDKTGKRLTDLQRALLESSWPTRRLSYEQIAQIHRYSHNYLKYDVGPKLWQLLSDVLQERVSKSNFLAALERCWQRRDLPTELHHDPTQRIPLYPDWGEAVDTSIFFGRKTELAQLQDWIVDQRCRCVLISGMGGMGKTSLAVKLAERIAPDFKTVIWRSLRDTPSLSSILQDWLQIITGDPSLERSTQLDDLLSRFLREIRQQRFLLVLDNIESVLPGETEFAQVWQRMGEMSHQSCLVLTSREKPKEIATLEGSVFPVRTLSLQGLETSHIQALLETKGSFWGSETAWEELVFQYSGNPLALKMVSTSILELFDGSVESFLEQKTLVFGDIHHLLDHQFRRLSDHEKRILYWLAINREAIDLMELRQDIGQGLPHNLLLESLDALRRRSWVDKTDHRFTLQPVILEFVTRHLVQSVSQELLQQSVHLWHSHALLKAQSKDYLREAQTTFIVQPLIAQLMQALGSRSALVQRLNHILNDLRQSEAAQSSYAAGNLINLLCQLKVDLHDYDFSGLAVWQAYLQGAWLPGVNFGHSDLSSSVFTETLGGALSVEFSPNGKWLATSDINGAIRVWQVGDGQLLRTCNGHGSWVCIVRFSPDNQVLASASEDHTVRLWDAHTGDCLRSLKGHTNWVWSVAFSPDGSLLASGGDDHCVHLWDPAQGELLDTFQDHRSRVCSVTFSPDGSLLASAGDAGLIMIGSIQNRTYRFLRSIPAHASCIWSIVFSPLGDQLATASEDHTIKLWDPHTGECLAVLQGHSHWVWSIAYSPDAQVLASASHDQSVKLWDVKSGRCLKTLQGHTSWVQSVAFNPEGTIVVSGGEDQSVKLWDVDSGKCLRTWKGYTSWVQSVKFSPDGSRLASTSEDHVLRLWNVSTGRCEQVLAGHTSALLTVDFAPEDDLLATAGFEHSIKLWRRSSGELLQTLRGHSSWIRALAFSATDPALLVSAGGDSTIRVWDPDSGQCLRVLKGHTNWVWSVAVWTARQDPQRSLLASGSDDGTVRLWSLPEGELLGILSGHDGSVTAVAFHPSGQMVASSSADQTIKIWDLQTQTCLTTLRGHQSSVWSICFSPDGSLLASSSADQSIKVWDVATRLCTQTLVGHSNLVFSVTFSPDGQWLASGSRDETIRIWQLASGRCDRILRAERPYEGMNIGGSSGLSLAQLSTLKTLGAIERPCKASVAS